MPRVPTKPTAEQLAAPKVLPPPPPPKQTIGAPINTMHVNDKPFRDGFERAIKQCGRIINESVPKKRARLARIANRRRIAREAQAAPMIGEGI